MRELQKLEWTVEELEEIVKEIFYWNGELEYLMVYENDQEFFDIFPNGLEIARAIYFGNYNFNDDYVRLNGYANIESLDNWEYEEELENCKDEILQAYANNYNELCTSFNLENKIEECEELTEEEKEKIKENLL